jgi:hypothetical protein
MMSTPSRKPMSEFAEYRFIKVMRGAPAHRKFRKLARSLGVSRFEALGVTVALWNLCDEKYPFGTLAGLDAESLADSIGIDHIDPDDLLKALVDAGLIDNADDGLVVHGWMDDGRSGAAAQKRSERAKKGAHARHHKDRSSPDCDICMSDASEHAPSYASEHPVAYQGTPLSVLDARRKTEDARRETRRIAPREEETRAYAKNDPERPFESSGKAAAR